ncbi:von Willebrand factor type A domain-containing protein [Alkalispirochaeta americana]|uniref:von Willebrand factor type A domain-containing protein n=1 Tax=Alkalispirochaeta americana TaxID=159291 RepID=A0A1N6VTG4_9SPIO|nr:VWA domain-containing protein [Alkalispirochaeta americana]SIQ81080.1 von Willebrand factor type A domain-containing protein [Alkalispirochaeta americana]
MRCPVGMVLVTALLSGMFFPGCEVARYPFYVETRRLNVAFVIDRSGSMGQGPDSRMENAKSAAVELVGGLDSQDILAVVTFDNDATVVAEARRISSGRRDEVIERISTITAGGGTTVSAGLVAGYSELSRNRSPGFWNILILLCDGDVDSAISEPLVRDAYARGVRTSTIGLAVSDSQMGDLDRLAELGRGVSLFVAGNEEVSEVIREAIDELLSP